MWDKNEKLFLSSKHIFFDCMKLRVFIIELNSCKGDSIY